MKQVAAVKLIHAGVFAAVICMSAGAAQAALFGDDEARTAIIELRQRLELQKQAGEATERRLAEESSQLRRSLLDLQNQIEALRAEQALLRGQNEQFVRELSQGGREMADIQRRQAALGQSLDERLRVLEPQKVTVDGKEFVVMPGEKRDFDAALAVFRSGDFAAAQTAWLEFAKRYPKSGYFSSALFWLGNAQYATRDYKEAITNFRAMLAQSPEHPRAPEALLSVANCQIELKDARAARKVLEDVVRLYPQSEAAQAAKDRLAKWR